MCLIQNTTGYDILAPSNSRVYHVIAACLVHASALQHTILDWTLRHKPLPLKKLYYCVRIDTRNRRLGPVFIT